MSISCGCKDMWLVFLTLILLTRFSQRGSLVSGGGQWADRVPHGCSRLIGISRRWGWTRHLPGGWPDGGPWSTGGKWTQRRAALAHAPIPDLTFSAENPSPFNVRSCHPSSSSERLSRNEDNKSIKVVKTIHSARVNNERAKEQMRPKAVNGVPVRVLIGISTLGD